MKCTLMLSVNILPTPLHNLLSYALVNFSGGYNLKAGPGSMIHLMKFDMGGAAATLGAAKAIAATKPAGVQVRT